MSTKSFLHWSNRYAKQTNFNGIKMTLIGGWNDLAAYYAGSDGNAWSHQMGWSNQGPIDAFKSRLQAGRIRGELLPEHRLATCDHCGQEGIGVVHICKD